MVISCQLPDLKSIQQNYNQPHLDSCYLVSSVSQIAASSIQYFNCFQTRKTHDALQNKIVARKEATAYCNLCVHPNYYIYYHINDINYRILIVQYYLRYIMTTKCSLQVKGEETGEEKTFTFVLTAVPGLQRLSASCLPPARRSACDCCSQ